MLFVNFLQFVNMTKKIKPIKKEFYNYMVDYFIEPNKKLSEIIGHDLSKWNEYK